MRVNLIREAIRWGYRIRNAIFLIQEGIPMRLYGLPLTNWDFAQDRGRNKWRCPIRSLVQYKDEKCPYRDIYQRKVSDYGRVFTPTLKRITVTLLLFQGKLMFGMSFMQKGGL